MRHLKTVSPPVRTIGHRLRFFKNKYTLPTYLTVNFTRVYLRCNLRPTVSKLLTGFFFLHENLAIFFLYLRYLSLVTTTNMLARHSFSGPWTINKNIVLILRRRPFVSRHRNLFFLVFIF